jgi:putative two-component system response regulator
MQEWRGEAQEPGGILAAPLRRRILIVDASSDNRDVLLGMLQELGHEVIEATSTTEALRLISREAIDLALVDLLAPDVGGPALCCIVRSHAAMQSIPIMLIADAPNAENEAIGIAAGADDFLVRPMRARVLLARVQSVLRRKSVLDSMDEAEEVLFALAQSVEARDPALARHCQRLALLASTLGVVMGRPAPDLIALHRGGYLHDIGKVAVPDSILFKPGRLTEEEWQIMKEHAIRGEQICSGMKSLKNVLPIVRHHHERWDGSGYPDRLRGEDIPLLARVLQIADIFDGLTTERPYKPAYTPEYALQIIQGETNAGWRDPLVVEAFSDAFSLFNSGDLLSSSSLQALSLSLQEQNRWRADESMPAAHIQHTPVSKAV